MANDLRVRTNFVAGSLSADMAAAATSMSSAGLADLDVIDTTNHAALELFTRDASGRITKREIVWVTAHTAAATTATVLRGREGTTAQDWVSGDRWALSPIVSDVVSVVTSATRPASPFIPQRIYETDTGRWLYWNGVQWAAEPHPSQTLGYAEIRSSQTGITTEVAITGLSVTVTVPAGRRLKISSLLHLLSNTANQGGQIRLKQDGVEIQFAEGTAGTTSGGRVDLMPTVVISPSAGTHTYSLHALRTGGSNTVEISGFAGDPSWLLVEDITGDAMPIAPTSVPVGVLAQAVSSGSQAVSTITALTIISQLNITVPAGRTLKITFGAVALGSASDNKATLFLRQDGAIISRAIADTQVTPRDFSMSASVLASPAAGSHTYRLDGELTNGSGTVTFSECYIIIEDITATPAPANTAPSSTLAYVEKITGQTGIGTTNTDLTDLTVNITIAEGRRIRITGGAYFDNQNAGRNSIALQIYEGATRLNLAQIALHESGVAGDQGNALVTAIETPSAGTHTYKLMAQAGVTTGVDMLAGSNFPAFLMVEDITGAGLPTGDGLATSRIVAFTASGTWTKPNGLKQVKIRMVGGGGSGGGTAATAAGQAAAGGGGGGGGYAEKIIAAVNLGSTETVTVGAGGAAASAGSAGNTGDTSSFGSHVSATGGAGGAVGASTAGPAATLPGSGGGSSGSDFGVTGEAGIEGYVIQATTMRMNRGGASVLGNPVRQTTTVPSAGSAGISFGVGGCGGQAGASAAAQGGAAGGDGLVLIEEYF